MNLRKPLPPFPLWALLILLIIAVLIVMSQMGCATCEPTIIKEPVEVEVPVPIPPEPLKKPIPPVMELCGAENSVQGKAKCIRRNIERWRIYAQKLVDEIEAHNAAIPQ